MNSTRHELINDLLENDEACDSDISDIIMTAIYGLRNNEEIKNDIDKIIMTFVEDLLWVESNILNKTENDKTSFLNAYNSGLGNAMDEIAKGAKIYIYRDEKLIDEISYDQTEYTDNSLGKDKTGKVKYYLVLKTFCGEAQGSTGSATIDPIVKPGEVIDVTVDLTLRVKDGINDQFIDRLNELLAEEDEYEESDAETQFIASQEDDKNDDSPVIFERLDDNGNGTMLSNEELRMAARQDDPCEDE